MKRMGDRSRNPAVLGGQLVERGNGLVIAQDDRDLAAGLAVGGGAGWRELLTEQQRKILNAACGDLASQLTWHGFRLTKDDWRHLLAGTFLGWRMMPGIDMGDGRPGFIMLGGSSLKLTKEQCCDAITQAFVIGDDPSSQGIDAPPVRWCEAVCKARWMTNEDLAA